MGCVFVCEIQTKVNSSKRGWVAQIHGGGGHKISFIVLEDHGIAKFETLAWGWVGGGGGGNPTGGSGELLQVNEWYADFAPHRHPCQL